MVGRRVPSVECASEVNMIRISRSLVIATGVFVMGGAAFDTMVRANAADKHDSRSGDNARQGCSNRTLKGDYGFSIEGTILAGTPNAFALRGVAMTHFDGEGNLTQVDFTTRNGVPMSPDWRPGFGTYVINEDCTGSAQIIQSDGTPSVNMRLVVVDRGREVRTVVVGNSTSSVGVRVR
jgi:hypothetical protein